MKLRFNFAQEIAHLYDNHFDAIGYSYGIRRLIRTTPVLKRSLVATLQGCLSPARVIVFSDLRLGS